MNKEELTPNETVVLSIIYELGEADVYDVLEYIKNEKDWQYTSVENFLSKLHAKGYVDRVKRSHRYRYKPKLPLGKVLGRVLDHLFRGILRDNPTPLVDYLLENRKLRPKDEKILRSLIDTVIQDDNKAE